MRGLRSVGVAASLVLFASGCAGRLASVDTLDSGTAADEAGIETGAPIVPCPPVTQVGTNVSCSTEGQTCPTQFLTGCTGGQGTVPVDCTCTGGTWACWATVPTCPQASAGDAAPGD